ncbi:unnamed protein product [Malus baccata var. baccata]
MPESFGEVLCDLRHSKGVLHIPLALPTLVLCQLGSLLARVVVGGTDLHGSIHLLFGSYMVVTLVVAGKSLATAGSSSSMEIRPLSMSS